MELGVLIAGNSRHVEEIWGPSREPGPRAGTVKHTT